MYELLRKNALRAFFLNNPYKGERRRREEEMVS
jgi:hypothetical protein